MFTPDKPHVLTLLVGVAIGGIALALTQFAPPLRAQEPARSDGTGQKQWAAVAPGRVEAASGEIKIGAPVVGRVAQVLVKPNDKVFAGEVLIRLDDDEALARLDVSEAQAASRKRARDDQSTPRRAGQRRKAEDQLGDAELAFADARAEFDKAAADRRAAGGSEENLNAARAAFERAQDHLREQRAELRRIKADPDTPLPNRTEGEFLAARAELGLADVMVEKTRIRAPIAGTVLQVNAKVGEIASPSPDQPLVLLADVSVLRVRAELDERDISLVHIGQPVVIRADAFSGREFEGKVASIAQFVGPGGNTSRGPRKLTDVDVMEVIVDLLNPGPLKIGMQVDVYFRNGKPPSH